jgi:hypothetical protein
VTYRRSVVPHGPQPPGGGLLTSGSLRWARGAVVGLSATCLASGGHLAGGGMAPSAGALALTALLAVVASTALSSRRWTLASLLLVLVGAQCFFHLAFAGPTSSAVFDSAMSHRGAVPAMGHDLPVGGAMSDMAMGGHHGWLMVASHLLAAVLSALVLRRGEEWSWRLLDLVGRPVRRAALELRPLSTPPRRPAAPTRAIPVLRSRLLLDVQSRRGPPQPHAG